MKRLTPAQRRARHVAAVEAATRPGDKVSAAMDYLRAVFAEVPPAVALKLAEDVAAGIIDRVDDLERVRAQAPR